MSRILALNDKHGNRNPDTETIQEEQDLYSYRQGLKHGVWLFAWWKDGVQYVGTCGTTLADALIKIENGEFD